MKVIFKLFPPAHFIIEIRELITASKSEWMKHCNRVRFNRINNNSLTGGWAEAEAKAASTLWQRVLEKAIKLLGGPQSLYLPLQSNRRPNVVVCTICISLRIVVLIWGISRRVKYCGLFWRDFIKSAMTTNSHVYSSIKHHAVRDVKKSCEIFSENPFFWKVTWWQNRIHFFIVLLQQNDPF